jgi:uncharacterized OB-fold protein
MSVEIPFTIEQFYRFVSEGKIMGVKCGKCGSVYIPPRQFCPKCFSSNLSWIQINNRGKLLSYTVIYVAPESFQQMAPYAYGIVELEGGARLPGIIKDVKHEDLKVGMELEIEIDKNVPQKWPQWPRYFFKPSKSS